MQLYIFLCSKSKQILLYKYVIGISKFNKDFRFQCNSATFNAVSGLRFHNSQLLALFTFDATSYVVNWKKSCIAKLVEMHIDIYKDAYIYAIILCIYTYVHLWVNWNLKVISETYSWFFVCNICIRLFVLFNNSS